MDVPKIIVFVNENPTSLQQHLLVELNRLEYAPMVDAVHTTSYEWFKNNVESCPHKMFVANPDKKELLFYQIDQIEKEIMFAPDLIVYFNEDFICSPSSWLAIKMWFHYILFNGDKTDLVKAGASLMKKPHKEIVGVVDMQKDEDKNQFYSFRYLHLEEDDVMLFEVCKPFTDLPYTSVIRTFSLVGPKPFFPSLYICTTWGVSRYDLPFLKHLWQVEFHWNVLEFDMDKMLKEATEACYPSPGMIPESEPEVYRRSIEQVVETLQERKTGKLCGGNHNDKGIEFWKRVQQINDEAEKENFL
jgi:hypothetical protein